MPKCAFPGTVEIVDTEEKAVVACAYLMAQSALGFDTETRPCRTGRRFCSSLRPTVVSSSAFRR